MDKLYIEGELFVLTEEHQENSNYVPQKKKIRASPLCRVKSTHSTDAGQRAQGRTTTEVPYQVNFQT